MRTFSIASPPHDPALVVATRISDSSFKRNLMGSPLETAVEIEGPYGDLLLHEDSTKPAVFLAGGIGVTPLLLVREPASLGNRCTCRPAKLLSELL